MKTAQVRTYGFNSKGKGQQANKSTIFVVCLSLLGTWSGKGNENWSSQSNLLQVLVSLQGLVLVSQPYFNEAGFAAKFLLDFLLSFGRDLSFISIFLN